MIGYEMDSSPVLVYTTAKTTLVEDFKYGWKNDMVVDMATLFARGEALEVMFLGQPQTVIQETWHLENSNLRHFFISFFFFFFFFPFILSAI